MNGRLGALAGGPVLDRHESRFRRSGIGLFRRCDAHVVAFDSDALCQFGARHVDPALDIRIPGVGGLAEVRGRPGLIVHLGKIRGDQQGRDLDGERKGRITRILLPSVLLRHRSVPHEKACGPRTMGQSVVRSSLPSAFSRRARSTRRIGNAVSSIWMPLQ